jgi:nucleoside-diphosphate-sugar epimerase
MKIAITGGTGFIGTLLAESLLADGHEVLLLDIKPSEKHPQHSRQVDICDAYALSEAMQGVDVIYHLAAEHRDDVFPRSRYYEVNEEGTDNVISAADNNGIKKIIFTSTVDVYGLNEGESRESDAPQPFNDYGKSKLKAEGRVRQWAGRDPTHSAAIVRLVATFGPGNRGNIYTLMDQIHRGRFVMIGPGRNRKSIAAVGNVAAFLRHCLNFKPGIHLYNYADKPDLITRDLVLTIRRALGLPGRGPHAPYLIGLGGGMVFDAAARLTGRTLPVSAIRVKKFCADTVVNADRLRETGFKPTQTLEEALQEMIAVEFRHDAA